MASMTTRAWLTSALIVVGWPTVVLPSNTTQPQGRAAYQVVKVCSLVSLAEIKKIAPWPPHIDAFAKAEEEPLGPQGSSCGYPTAHVQVMAFDPQFVDVARKQGGLVPVAGIGDEAHVRNNRNLFAELYARIGPHLLTVQMDIGTNQTFESARSTLVEVAGLFASRLR